MAHYDGGDFTQWIVREKPDLIRRKTVLIHLAQALQHLHAHNVAHGDIKLQNVLISAQGTGHLADFELSREEQAAPATKTYGVTTVGGFTPQYVAPEMLGRSHRPPPTCTRTDYA